MSGFESEAAVGTFILATLALWRVSRMLVLEDGPLYLFSRFRNIIGIYEEDGQLQSDNWVGTLFTCPLCVATWLSIPLTIYLREDWLYWLGLAGAACVLFRFSEK